MDTEILTHKEQFLNLVIEKLGKSPVDFCETADFVTAENAKQAGMWGVAGVLVPLFFMENGAGGEFAFKLIKRSTSVVQAGDLSCPGGMLHPLADEVFRPFVASGLLPVLRGKPRQFLKEKGLLHYRQVTLFLANALRESWEEIGLSPFNVSFLGPLPCNPLIAFTRIIFPLVGYIKQDRPGKLSQEVEKIVNIPLREFFNENNYCNYTIESEYPLKNNVAALRDFPCFTVLDNDGNREILWGATFFIIVNFLKTVMDFELPESHKKRTIKKVLKAEYITGIKTS